MAQQQAHETICQHLQITKAGPLNLVEWKTNLADRWDGLTEVNVRFCSHLAILCCKLTAVDY